MHHPANPARENIAEIRTMLLQFRLWLLELLACVAGWAGSRELKLIVQEEVRYARRCVKQFLFLLAFAQIDVPQVRRRMHRHPPNAKPGFRRNGRYRRINRLRHFLRGVKLRTLKQIKAVMDDIDAVATRAAKRVHWRVRSGAFVVRSAGDPALVLFAPLHAGEVVCVPDTS